MPKTQESCSLFAEFVRYFAFKSKKKKITKFKSNAKYLDSLGGMEIRDSINCVESVLAPIRKGDHGGPTIWIGSNSGKAVSLTLSVPQSSQRNTTPLICSPTGNIESFNRYKRGLETCQQANLHQSGRECFLLFFPTPPSDEYGSAPSRKYSRPLWCKFACIG